MSFSTIRFTLGALLVCGLAAAPATASTSFFSGDSANSTEGLADFDGKIEYTFLGGTAGTLEISLTNTTDADIGGYLTGFAFNVGGFDVSLDLTSATHPFLELTDENAPPFGVFRSGAALGGDWTGGGSPKKGIKVGDTGVFDFDVTSLDAGLLSAGTFLAGGNDFNFVARFRGLTQDGSDKVPAGNIPAPGATSLVAAAGLVATRRRRA